MELRELAEHVLFSTSLEDKLKRPDSITDHQPGSAMTEPVFPHRPDILKPQGRHTQERIAFPNLRQLESDVQRGIVMHFFANHELLALELMALVLLKFPDAPPSFRMGVAQTLFEEQDHVRLYMDRMHELGMAMGELPVNDYFWRCIAPMNSPIDFVARLSLTFEQANLDYSRHFCDVFSTVGDTACAAIMDRVYKDEIGHVNYGLTWFEAWRDKDKDMWDCYCDHLDSPLSPMRAKGIGFNREGRLDAGLNEAFIDRVDLFSQTVSRPPDVYWFNPLCDTVASGESITAKKPVQELQSDLAPLMQFMANETDVVVVDQEPGHGFQRRIKDAGYTIPEWAVVNDLSPQTVATALSDRAISRFKPWGEGPDAAVLAAKLTTKEPYRPWEEIQAELFHKGQSVSCLSALLDALDYPDWCMCESDTPRVATSIHDLDEIIDTMSDHHQRLAIKSVFSSSGQGIKTFERPMPQGIRRWVDGLLARHGCVVVEPWLDRVADLSWQFTYFGEDHWRSDGLVHFMCTAQGQFVGAHVGALKHHLPAEVSKFLFFKDQSVSRFEQLERALRGTLKPWFAKHKDQGVLGVDMLIYRDHAGALRLRPIVEINPRMTMGRVALRLQTGIHAKQTGVWYLIPVRHVNPSVEVWSQKLAERYPLEFNDGKITSGALCMTDPELAKQVLAVMVVGQPGTVPSFDDMVALS